MKYSGIIAAIMSLLFLGCSDSYQQHYDNFSEFNKANERNKGWFPDCVSIDAYNLKNTSYLDSLCAFGTFSYSNSNFYDSIFTNPSADKIDFSKFEQKVRQHINRKPDWFLSLENVFKNEYEAIQIERFSIVRHIRDKKVYFVLSN
jgi:hypothetical protein